LSASGDVSFREALGLDSMDFLSIVEKIAEQTGVEIPEANYPDVESLDGMCAFLAEHT
jgi:acyl carrier protein